MKSIIVRNHLSFSKDFEDCCTANKYTFLVRCSSEAKQACLKAQFSDPEFYQRLAEEYLLERGHYRDSGIRTRRFVRGMFVSSRPEESGPALDGQGRYRWVMRDIMCDYHVVTQAPATRPLARDARRHKTSLGSILQTQLLICTVVWALAKFIQFACMINKFDLKSVLSRFGMPYSPLNDVQ